MITSGRATLQDWHIRPLDEWFDLYETLIIEDNRAYLAEQKANRESPPMRPPTARR